MRVALLFGTPPKKLGSLEQWMTGVAAEVRRRGHALDVFTYLPVHPEVKATLEGLGVGLGAIEELQSAPVPAVRRLASYDVLHVNMFRPRSDVALCCYAAWPAKIIMVDHGSGIPAPGGLPLRQTLSHALDQVTLARVDRLVGVSEYVRRRDVERFGLDPARTQVIYNGVDPSRFDTAKTPNPTGTLRILTVAQLIPEKGIDVLLRALAATRGVDFTLRVVGYGRMHKALRALSAELGLGARVEFLGKRDDVHRLIRDADVCIHPAVWEEAFGLTVTEGMASGCAVIATRSGGIPEIIEDGRDGLLVPKGHATALAGAIERLARDADLRRRLAEEGRRKVERAFTLERCIREHVDGIEDIAFDRSASPVFARKAQEGTASSGANVMRGTAGPSRVQALWKKVAARRPDASESPPGAPELEQP